MTGVQTCALPISTYTLEHIYEVWRAIQEGYDIRSYIHWSQVDNFEWERGWSQRFGLYDLDIKTQKRTRRPSADMYAQICKKNALSKQTVNTFAPNLVESLFKEK